MKVLGNDPDLDEHELRAQELDALGWGRRAAAIRGCGRRSGTRRQFACRDRLCPSCAPRRAGQVARKQEALIRQMENPTAFLVVHRSRWLEDLPQTQDDFRLAFRKLRRKVRFRRHARRGCGALEPMLSIDGTHWQLHAHVVMDVAGLDLGWLDAEWRRLSDGRGFFRPARDRTVRRKDIGALARYNTKADTWCPRPGELSLRALSILVGAVRGRQLPVQWGFRRRGSDAPRSRPSTSPSGEPKGRRGRPPAPRSQFTGADLRAWRLESRLTQQEAGRLIGRTSRTVRSYEFRRDLELPEHIASAMRAATSAGSQAPRGAGRSAT